jgi:hypothetical protein
VAAIATPSPQAAGPGMVTGSFPPIAVSPESAFTAEISTAARCCKSSDRPRHREIPQLVRIARRDQRNRFLRGGRDAYLSD